MKAGFDEILKHSNTPGESPLMAVILMHTQMGDLFKGISDLSKYLSNLFPTTWVLFKKKQKDHV